MIASINISKLAAGVLLALLALIFATGLCCSSEAFSWSITQSRISGQFISELIISPEELTVGDKKLIFGSAWWERRSDGDYAICFRIQEGDSLFQGPSDHFFVLDDRTASVSMRSGRGWHQFVQRVESDEVSEIRMSLMENWRETRQKTMRFIRKQ
jgi:hypothetical protein